METNELPEDVIKQIDAEAAKVEEWSGFTSGAEFGYRLALQSKEEEVKQLNANNLDLAMDCQDHLATIKQLEEQLKAKDEENERLRGLVRKALLDASQDTFKNFKGEYMMKVFKVYADEWCIENGVPLLSQSTDKP